MCFIKVNDYYFEVCVRIRMIDIWYIWRLATNIAGLMLSLILAYFTVRLLLIFRGGEMQKGWLYLSYGVFFLSVGSSLFIFNTLFGLHQVVPRIGNTLILIGAALCIIGMYSQYKVWNRLVKGA